jgi:hypothetical protein
VASVARAQSERTSDTAVTSPLQESRSAPSAIGEDAVRVAIGADLSALLADGRETNAVSLAVAVRAYGDL